MQDYPNSDIIQLRKERELTRNVFLVLTKEIEQILNVFRIDYGVTLITWSDLVEFDLDTLYPVNDKVKFMKTQQCDDSMVFETYMEPGGDFGLHHHDIVESVFIKSGNLVELERGGKKYIEGDTVIYSANEKHKPTSTVGSVYSVVFTRKI
ncbi:hypothetical protein COB72_10915 [bacterium]|nr:MAG: hypothetical protein COB72_10915 [bacterium]